MIKIILSILVILLAGCNDTVKVDSNGSEIKREPIYEKVILRVACDERGYAYNRMVVSQGVIYVPIVENRVGGLHAMKCNEKIQ